MKQLKILFLGNQGVGKSTLQHQFSAREFKDLTPTVGMDYRQTIYKDTTLLFFDTAGEERFRSVSRKLLRNMDAVVFCYDLSKPQSFDDLGYWIELFKENGQEQAGRLICGLKLDLGNIISEEQTLVFQQTYGNFDHYQVSTKNFQDLVPLLDRLTQMLQLPVNQQTQSVKLVEVKGKQEKGCCE